MNIRQCRIDRAFAEYADEYKQKACEVLDSSSYILGTEVEAFENEFASYEGLNYCVGVANGTDALYIALRALGITAGDEVLLSANGFVADYLSVVNTEAKPIPIDIREDYLIDCNEIEKKITKKTKAILVVHLYGAAVNMFEICKIAKKYGLKVIEDCAQSVGTSFNGRKTGTFGDAACFSFFPTKNLGGFGDGGAVLTNDSEIAEKMKVLRFYGSPDRITYTDIGINSRLDELQAGLLRVKLKYLDSFLADRKKIGEYYLSNIKNSKIILPVINEETEHTFHQFVITSNSREDLIEYLQRKGIMTRIHYPILPYLTPAYRFLNYTYGTCPVAECLNNRILSLPIYNGMTDEEKHFVIEAINSYK